MDWLESHRGVIDYLNKSFVCVDDEGKSHSIKGIYRPMSLQQISVVQLKKCSRKGCQLYVVKLIETELEK